MNSILKTGTNVEITDKKYVVCENEQLQEKYEFI